MRILVFLHGTAIMHRTAAGRPRAERVRIGGRSRTIAAGLGATAGRAVTSVILPEFGGLAHLPDDPGELTSYGA